jgi:hypothetical protein
MIFRRGSGANMRLLDVRGLVPSCSRDTSSKSFVVWIAFLKIASCTASCTDARTVGGPPLSSIKLAYAL